MTFQHRLSENHIVRLSGKHSTVFVGKGLELKVNSSVGLNSEQEFDQEVNKILTISNHNIQPDIMMDLSTQKISTPLYNVIAEEIGCPVGIIPHYVCFKPTVGIDKSELLETIEQAAMAGVSFLTLHFTADLEIAEKSLSRRIPIISRGGSLILRDMKRNNRRENILLQCFDDIIQICKKYNVAISLGTTFRPSTLNDAMDYANLKELEIQKDLCEALIERGIHVLMEGIGHIPLLKIASYVDLLRKGRYVPFMPLGPIVSDFTAGQDHITSAVGASYMATLGGADIINAVTREEHTGGIPTIQSILEAIDVANTVVKIVNNNRFPNDNSSSSKRLHNCMGIAHKVGCSRCGFECPFIWNDEQ